jgi:hypothetical protein
MLLIGRTGFESPNVEIGRLLVIPVQLDGRNTGEIDSDIDDCVVHDVFPSILKPELWITESQESMWTSFNLRFGVENFRDRSWPNRVYWRKNLAPIYRDLNGNYGLDNNLRGY